MQSHLALFGLVSLFAFTEGFSSEQNEFRLNTHKQCLEDSNVDEALVQQLRQRDFSNDDQTLQLYVFCTLRHYNLITPEGQFNREIAISMIPEDVDRNVVEAAIDTCILEQGVNPREYVWKMTKCYHENNPGYSFI